MAYIAPAAKTLQHVDRLVDWRRGIRRAPVTVEWDLSNRCALGCQACHFAHTHVRGPWASRARTLPMAYEGTGDLADIDVVGRALHEMAASGVEGVVWSGGGEPTTHPFWLSALEYAQEAGLEQGMYTFGGLLTEETARRAKHILRWVVVSLDAHTPEAYSAEKGVPAERFSAACQGVRWLSGGQATLGVSFLLHAGNYGQAMQMRDFALGMGADYVTFRPTIDVDAAVPAVPRDRGWIRDAWPMLERLAASSKVEISLERFQQYAEWTGHGYATCHGVTLNTTVTPDGRVWLCPQRRGVGQALGRLDTEAFQAVWSRHPGSYTVDAGCRVMCRLHPVNQTISAMHAPHVHGAFV